MELWKNGSLADIPSFCVEEARLVFAMDPQMVKLNERAAVSESNGVSNARQTSCVQPKGTNDDVQRKESCQKNMQ